MKTPSAALVALTLTVSAVPLLAHHTISAIYDTNKVVTLKGVVTQVDWQNPHVVLHLDAKNDDGTTVSWNVETRATYILKRCGLGQDFVKAGEAVSMDVVVAKDGTRRAALETITLPSGTSYLSMAKPSC
jgi:hypothetical protein